MQVICDIFGFSIKNPEDRRLLTRKNLSSQFVRCRFSAKYLQKIVTDFLQIFKYILCCAFFHQDFLSMSLSESDLANYLIDNDCFYKIQELAEVRNVNVQVIVEDIFDQLNHNMCSYYDLSKQYMSGHCSSAYLLSVANCILDVFYAKEVEGTARGFPMPGN